MDTRFTEADREGPQGRAVRRSRAVQWALLAGVVGATLAPLLLLPRRSQVVLLELTVSGLLGLLPGVLYMQFTLCKGRSLYDEYVLNLFRLHIDEYRNLPAPPTHTSYYRSWREHHDQLQAGTTDNLYRRKFEAVHGRHSVSTIGLLDPRSLKDRTHTFLPVLVATLLLCLGWVLVVRPLSGEPGLPTSAPQLGFIGAYWFILQDLVRRYFRDDLNTGAYVSASARIVVVGLLVAALDLVPLGSGREQAIFAFFVGVFPQLGVQALKAALAKSLGRAVPAIRTAHPLSDIEGLTIWDQARLLEEGIEDMENLVTANLVDLLLHSRVPVGRLVDWLDQAVLYLRLEREPEGDSPRQRLGRLGIRSATDLQRAWASPLAADPVFRRKLGWALGAGSAGPVVAEALLASFEGEANLYHVAEFKRHEWLLRDARRGVSARAPLAAVEVA